MLILKLWNPCIVFIFKSNVTILFHVSDHGNQSESRGVDTYENLESRAVVGAKNENTYQSLQTTDRPDSGGIAMELYENTQITW